MPTAIEGLKWEVKMNNQELDLGFLNSPENNLFTEIDTEKKLQQQKENEKSDNKDFITELPEWDLLPPNEGVKRVVKE